MTQPGRRTAHAALLILSALSVCAAPGCAKSGAHGRGAAPAAPVEFDFAALGTTFNVAFYPPGPAAADAAADGVAARLTDLAARVSPDRPDGELARLCGGAGGPPRKVSDDLYAVLDAAQRVAKASDGAFDVTAAPYHALWRRAAEAGAEPADEQLAAVRPLVGWEKLRLDPIERTASLDTAGMRLDPAGIAPAYAADCVLEVLKAHAIERARVETGPGPLGRVFVFGAPPPGQDGWDVEVRTGRPAPGGRPRLGRMFNGAVAFSATALGAAPPGPGRRAPRPLVLDPSTGRRLTDPPGVIVFARRGASGAALAAAAVVMGPGRGEGVIKAAGAVAHYEPAGPAQLPAPAGGRPKRT